MTLSSPDLFASYSNNAGVLVRDVAPLLLTAMNKTSRVLQLIQKRPYEVAQNRKIEWEHETLAPHTVTVGTAGISADPADVTLPLVSGHVNRVRPGDKLSLAGGETMEIISMDVAANTVTLNGRGFGYTDPAAHASGVVLRVQPSRSEGSEAGTDISPSEDFFYNYTQILDIMLEMSGSQLSVKSYNITNKYERERNKRTLEIANQFADVMINGVMSGAPSGTVYGSMAGLIQWLKDPNLTTLTDGTVLVDSASGAAASAHVAGENLYTAAETFNYDTISNAVGLLADAGADTDSLALVGRRTLLEGAYAWGAPTIRRAPGEISTFGGKVNEILTKQGIPLALVDDIYWPSGHLGIVDFSKISAVYLAGRQWTSFTSPLGDKLADKMGTRILGEWSLRVYGAGEHHALFSNIS